MIQWLMLGSSSLRSLPPNAEIQWLVKTPDLPILKGHAVHLNRFCFVWFVCFTRAGTARALHAHGNWARVGSALNY